MQLERIKVPRDSQVKCQVVNKQDSRRGGWRGVAG